MGKIRNGIKMLLARIGIGTMLLTTATTATGCGKEEFNINEFYQNEATDLDEFVNAIENGDEAKANEILEKFENEQQKYLSDARKNARKNHESSTDYDNAEKVVQYLSDAMKIARDITKKDDLPDLNNPQLFEGTIIDKGAELYKLSDAAEKMTKVADNIEALPDELQDPAFKMTYVVMEDIQAQYEEFMKEKPESISNNSTEILKRMIADYFTYTAKKVTDYLTQKATNAANNFNKWVEDNHFFDEVSPEGSTGEAKATPETTNSRNKEFKQKYNFVPAVNACIAEIDPKNDFEEVNPHLEQVCEDRIQEDKEAKEKAARVAQAEDDDRCA